MDIAEEMIKNVDLESICKDVFGRVYGCEKNYSELLLIFSLTASDNVIHYVMCISMLSYSFVKAGFS